MNRFLEFQTGDENSILIEVNTPLQVGPIKAGIGDVIDKAIDKAQAKLEDIVAGAIRTNVDMLYSSIKQLPDPPQEIEITFGLKFTTEGNIAIGKLGGEFNYAVKLTWKA